MNHKISIPQLIINKLKGSISDLEQKELQEWVCQAPERQRLIEEMEIFPGAAIVDEAIKTLLERDIEAIERKLLERLGWKTLPVIRKKGRI